MNHNRKSLKIKYPIKIYCLVPSLGGARGALLDGRFMASISEHPSLLDCGIQRLVPRVSLAVSVWNVKPAENVVIVQLAPEKFQAEIRSQDIAASYLFSVAQPSRLRVKSASSPSSHVRRRDVARTRRRGGLYLFSAELSPNARL